jgi:hypothetical protein
MQRIREALGAAAGRVDVPGNVELHHLLVKGVPEAIAERRRFDAAALAGIGVQQEADETALLDALFEIRKNSLGAHARGQWQAADAAKRVRIQFHLLRNDVVGFLDEPLHEPRVLAGHHLIGARRDELQVGPDFFQLPDVRAATKDRGIKRLPDIFLGGEVAATAVSAAVRQDLRLVHVKAVRRGDVSM